MLRRVSLLIGFCLMMGFVMQAYAQPPVAMLQSTSDRLIAALKKEGVNLKNRPKRVYRMVEQIVLPNVDVIGMSRSVVGRNAWFAASPAVRQRFTKEFTDLVIRTYAAALARYTEEEVRYLPIRGSIAGKTRVQVSSVIYRPGAPSVPVNYRLIKMGSSWKVYDLSVEGVSLLQSFRSQFASDLSEGGLANLTNKLAEHNAKFQ